MIEDLGWLTEGKLAGSGGLIHPVVDETAPTQAQVDEFVALVDEMLDQGQPVLVHCRGGYGRAGTMLACYLVSRGRGAEEALTEVRARCPGSIVPRVQQACVVKYAERLRHEEQQGQERDS